MKSIAINTAYYTPL